MLVIWAGQKKKAPRLRVGQPTKACQETAGRCRALNRRTFEELSTALILAAGASIVKRVMSQLRLRKKPPAVSLQSRRDQPLQRWRIIRLKKTPAAKIGYVFAADRASAIDRAIAEFDVPEPLRHRLMALRAD
jgi:hypothetical protein